MKVKFYEIVQNIDVKYSVIVTYHDDQIVVVRHKDRNSWEIPGGHIEENETPLEAAKRELKEETGALKFKIKPVAYYIVERGEIESCGKLFYATIDTFEALNFSSEIGEVQTFDMLPNNLTYPIIQPKLLDYTLSVVV